MASVNIEAMDFLFKKANVSTLMNGPSVHFSGSFRVILRRCVELELAICSDLPNEGRISATSP